MYQFFINSEDNKVIDYLKFLTFLSREEIEALEEKNRTEPHLREAHKTLAKEVITFIHGEEAYNTAIKIRADAVRRQHQGSDRGGAEAGHFRYAAVYDRGQAAVTRRAGGDRYCEKQNAKAASGSPAGRSRSTAKRSRIR